MNLELAFLILVNGYRIFKLDRFFLAELVNNGQRFGRRLLACIFYHHKTVFFRHHRLLSILTIYCKQD